MGEAINLLVLVPFILLQLFGLSLIFKKAGVEPWKAWVPFFNLYVWVKLVNKPLWWFLVMFVPVLNVLIYLGMIIELCKCLGINDFGRQFFALFASSLAFPFFGLKKEIEWIGPEEAEKYKKKNKRSSLREWADAIAFAVIAATIIRWFLIEAYTIPTPSMEKSLLVGDYLFVSKAHYGMRVPMTPVSFPFTHNTLPGGESKSYLSFPKLPYLRFPGIEDIENGDIVVFNYPRDLGHPVDKKENYIKRCVGIPGDTLSIENTQIFIDGQKQFNPEQRQYLYRVYTKQVNALSPRRLREMEIYNWLGPNQEGTYAIFLSEERLVDIKQIKGVEKVEQQLAPDNTFDQRIYPYYKNLAWNIDNYGPIYIPKTGDTVYFKSRKEFEIYEMPIEQYEGDNELDWRDGKVFLNGEQVEYYVFNMDYFFMMGDNRHNSQDSRYWGFVPENHIVGKALFIWFSHDKHKGLFNGIRWSRLFTIIEHGKKEE